MVFAPKGLQDSPRGFNREPSTYGDAPQKGRKIERDNNIYI